MQIVDRSALSIATNASLPEKIHQALLAACLQVRFAAQLAQLHGTWSEAVTCAKYAPQFVLIRAAF